jgi:RNA polymerase sigma-70 factor (ECF subfamily)
MSTMSTDGTPDDVDTYRRHAPELTRYATVLVGPDDAADIVADAVLSAMRSPAWRHVEHRRAYLYRAVLHTSASFKRSTARRRRREDLVAARATPEPTIDETSIDARRTLAVLSPQQRAVVFLTYWQDQRPDQIAELLDIGEGTVRKQLARARETLRRTLDG